jgi:hypothetical protein
MVEHKGVDSTPGFEGIRLLLNLQLICEEAIYR